MRQSPWVLSLVVLLGLAVLVAAVAMALSFSPFQAMSELPTVTPPSPGEPTLSPEALAMRAAPTATPGSPPSPPPSPTSTFPLTPRPTPTPVTASGHQGFLIKSRRATADRFEHASKSGQ
jgi:hypothetical protein